MSIAQLRTGNLLAARKIAKSLGQTEASIDTSILAQTDLLAAIVDGRRQSGAGIQMGHSAFKKAMAALDAMAEARDLLVDCHADLTDVRDRFRFRGDDLGCTGDKGQSAVHAKAA